MTKYEIPLRPKGRRYKLTANEQDCLTWYVISGCKREDAYRIFVRPDLTVSKINLRTMTSQFFSAMEVREYIEAYRSTLDGSTTDSEQEGNPEKRAAAAVQKFTDKVVDKMMGDLDTVDEMDAVAKLADRVGVLDDKDKTDMEPVRVLPVRCKSECRYRAFVETQVTEGRIFDECNYCRAKAYAEERGFIYDPCKLLDIPQDVIERIDSKNNVQITDILSGKVEN